MAEELIPAERQCAKCLIGKPETAEHFPRWKDGRNGLARECRACRSAYMKARYLANPEPTKARSQAERDAKPKKQGPPLPAGLKICRECWAMKPANLEYFVAAKHGCAPDKVSSPCKVCSNKKTKAFKKRHPEKVRVSSERYREVGRRKSKEWREANPERYSALCKANSNRRRVVEDGTAHFTADDVQKQKSSQQGRCWWCQCKLNTYEVDHRIPVSKGGPNTAANIVISCKPCNRRKSAKMPWELDNPRLL